MYILLRWWEHINPQGFRKADAAPITIAKARPTPAPREAPTAAAVKEDDLAWASRLASIAVARSRVSSAKSLSLASSLSQRQHMKDLLFLQEQIKLIKSIISFIASTCINSQMIFRFSSKSLKSSYFTNPNIGIRTSSQPHIRWRGLQFSSLIKSPCCPPLNACNFDVEQKKKEGIKRNNSPNFFRLIGQKALENSYYSQFFKPGTIKPNVFKLLQS